MPTTAAEKIQRAAHRQRKSWAALARETGIPAPWIRSFATGHVHKGDPERIRRLSDALALDYREMLALTDQLGAVEAMEQAPVVASASSDVAALVATVGRLVDQLEQERREWREERREWRALLDRLLPGGGATLSVEDDEGDDPFEDSPLTEAGRAAARLAHDDLTAEAAAGPVTALRPPSSPRTPAGRSSR